MCPSGVCNENAINPNAMHGALDTDRKGALPASVEVTNVDQILNDHRRLIEEQLWSDSSKPSIAVASERAQIVR